MILNQHNNHGFSLVEILISIGLLGAVAVGGLKLFDSTSVARQNLELDREIMGFQSELEMRLGDKLICEKNFQNKTVSQSSIDQILDNTNVIIYQKNSQYLNGKILIQKMSTVATDQGITFEIVYKKLIDKAASEVITKRFPLLVNLDNALTTITGCFSLTESMASTLNFLVAKNLCEKTYGANTPAFNQYFDPVAKKCHFPGQSNVNCSPGETVRTLEYDIANKTWKPTCSRSFTAVDCPVGWIKKVNTNGTFQCALINSIIDTTSLTFNAPASCGLEIYQNKIRLDCD